MGRRSANPFSLTREDCVANYLYRVDHLGRCQPYHASHRNRQVKRQPTRDPYAEPEADRAGRASERQHVEADLSDLHLLSHVMISCAVMSLQTT